MKLLPDGSAFFVMDIDTSQKNRTPIMWNPGNKVVQDHRDGTIIHPDTDIERSKRGLPIPWSPEMADKETREPDIP